MKTRYFFKSLAIFCLLSGLAFALTAQEATPEATEMTTPPDQIIIRHEGLFPEGLVYDPQNLRFLLSSTAEGTVYAVGFDGSMSPFIEDERVVSSVGMELDAENNRLLVAASNTENQAFLGIYDLATGENLHVVDFSTLAPESETFANDVTVDAEGNAYVTDSAAGLIYRVDMDGNASVFLEDDAFSAQAFALNGIAYHQTGNYLIAVLVPGLIKIPLDNPENFTQIQLEQEIPGEDGLFFMDENTLALSSNAEGHVYRLESSDDFETAQITGHFLTGDVFPTTLAMVDDRAYVLYSFLNRDTSMPEFYIQAIFFTEQNPAEATDTP
jgi:sugar lactone lactonase YvrE